MGRSLSLRPGSQPDEPLKRNFPTDSDSEAAVLGSILLLPDVFDEVSVILEPDDFFEQPNRLSKRLL